MNNQVSTSYPEYVNAVSDIFFQLFLQSFWSQIVDEWQLANINELHLKQRNKVFNPPVAAHSNPFPRTSSPGSSPLHGSSCTSASSAGYSSNPPVVSGTHQRNISPTSTSVKAQNAGGKAYPATGDLLLSAQVVRSSFGEIRHLPRFALVRRLPLHRVAAQRDDKHRWTLRPRESSVHWRQHESSACTEGNMRSAVAGELKVQTAEM